MKIIIIGGVAGGATAAARLRRLDEKAEIILLEKGGHLSYANCGLPYYIGDTISDRDRLFMQSVEGFSSKYAVDARVNSEVVSIDASKKEVTIKSLQEEKEYTESYDKLLISTGAAPVKLPLLGIEDKRIFTLRDVADTDYIKDFINKNKPKKALVVGAGFIGLEMVENLHDLGIEVTIVQREDQVMLPLDVGMAAIVHQTLANNGIQTYLENEVKEFKTEGDRLQAHLKNGEVLETDLVIMSIGVRPETGLARAAGLEIGERGGIKVNEYLQTSDKDIYAVGDVIEVTNLVTKKQALIPLAGPANKQGRIAADNIILGNQSKYKGSIGTSIAKVFDITVAAAGANSKLLDAEGIAHYQSYTHGNSNATYYPGALPVAIKMNFSKEDGKILGAQVIGNKGVTEVIDIFAEAIRRGDTVYDLQEVEHAYAPPYATAKHSVNVAGYVGQNILEDKVKTIQWEEMKNLNPSEVFIIDSRPTPQYEMGHIEGAHSIPTEQLRKRLQEVPRDKKIVIYCAIGYNGYLASQILRHNGFENVYNLSGGYRTYGIATKNHFERIIKNNSTPVQNIAMGDFTKDIIKVDAKGLMCPGPILKLKKNYDELGVGQQLEIEVTDQAFGQDLEGWSNMVGARIIDLKNAGGIVTARIEKQTDDNSSPAPSCSITKPQGNGQTLIVFSDNFDKALASFVIANGAAAAGKKVSMFFTFWGLNVIKKQNKPKVKKDIFGKMFGMMMPSSSSKLKLSQMNMGGMGRVMMKMVMKKKNVDSIETLMQQAKENGVEFIACSMSMDVMGIKAEELMDGVTIGGVAAYLDRANNANGNLFI